MEPNSTAVQIEVDIQHHVEHKDCPSDDLITHWAQLALNLRAQDTEISVLIVDNDEMSALNQEYRHKQGPTNVLAFPFEGPDDLDLPLLGDLVICLPKMMEEASAQHKTLEQHFAHLTIHGCLHLLGYDHDIAERAEQMEQLEIDLLKKLNFPNPYQERVQ